MMRETRNAFVYFTSGLESGGAWQRERSRAGKMTFEPKVSKDHFSGSISGRVTHIARPRPTQGRRSRCKCSQQAGFTLIELLLYVTLVGMLLSSIIYLFGLSADARLKNQTVQEVNDQGTALMDTMTQTVRNATAVTSPAVGTSGSSLTLTVPTGSLSPTVFDIAGAGTSTVMGYNADGGTTDSGDANSIDATKFTATATGTISSLFALVGPTVGTSPNNKGQMAIYSGTTPTTLLASSGDVVLTASAWNTFPIATVNITSGQTYWLAYNTNGSSSTQNNLRIHTGASGVELFVGQTYGSWPASWTGTSSNSIMSVYANIVSGGASSGTAEVKEGSNTAVPLLDSNVQLTSLTFKNLTRSGTPGVVQISFVLAALNPNNKNEYDYQKTFTSTAEVTW